MNPADNLRAANDKRAGNAGKRDAADMAAALAALGASTPDRYRRVAEARIADPDATWRDIAGQLGMTKDQAIGYCRRLIKSAKETQ